MRILHLTSHLNVGGITTTVVSLAEACARRGDHVMVASGGGPLERRLTANGISCVRVPLHTSAELSPPVGVAYARLARMLRTQPADLVHAHTRVAQVVAHGLWRRHRIPYVTTWHGFYRRRLSRRWWPCTGLLTIAISEPVARHLRDVFLVPPERIKLIPHGIDVARFAVGPSAEELRQLRERLGLPEASCVIGTVSRLAPDKGLEHLLEGFRALRHRMPDVQLLIVGDGAARAALERRARTLGIASAVHFAGSLPDTRLALALMEVFVFVPASREGFGLSLLEAMASARPIVAIRRGDGASWVLDEHPVGLVVAPEDPDALAGALARILSDANYGRQLGAHAQQIARSHYNLERVVEQVEGVYRECLAHAQRLNG